MWKGAKSRATAIGVEFNLDPILDVCAPKFCPVLGIPLFVADGKAGPNSPTLDRIDPNRGYVSDNVIVVSQKANTIKSNATPAEIRRVANFYSKLIRERKASAAAAAREVSTT